MDIPINGSKHFRFLVTYIRYESIFFRRALHFLQSCSSFERSCISGRISTSGLLLSQLSTVGEKKKQLSVAYVINSASHTHNATEVSLWSYIYVCRNIPHPAQILHFQIARFAPGDGKKIIETHWVHWRNFWNYCHFWRSFYLILVWRNWQAGC